MKIRKVKVLGVVILVSLALASCGSGKTAPATTSPIPAASTAAPTLTLGKAMTFGLPTNTSIISSGWSGAEAWGMWSDGKIATLDFSVDSADSKGITLALDSHAFLAKGHETIHVDILANTVKLATWSYTPTDKTSIRNLVVPAKALADQPGHLKLTFVIKSPASPKGLGLSADARQLGIGLVSIELIKVN